MTTDEAVRIAKEFLTEERVSFGKLCSCELTDPPHGKATHKIWAVEFEGRVFQETGIRIGNDHLIVIVNDNTGSAEIFPTM